MGLRDEELQKSERLEKLKERLYSPGEQFGLRRRRELHKKSYQLEKDWAHDTDPFVEETPKKKVSLFLKLLIGAFFFFLATLLYAGYVMINSGPKEGIGEIDIAIIGPVSVGAGETLSYDIVIQNNDVVPIETVDLVVTYPDGSKNPENLSEALPRVREGVGDLDIGDTIKRTKTVALFGNENDNKQIEVGIEYRIPGISTIFKKKKVFDITLQSSPIRIALESIDEHVVGQELNMELTITSNSTKILENVMVVADYPFGFSINDKTNQPNFGNNVWLLGKLEPKEERKIKISGDLQGQDNEERVFHFHTGIQDEVVEDKLGVTFSSLLQTIDIAKPFFAIDISLDGDSNATVIRDGQKIIQATVNYTNNLNDSIYDAEVVLKFSGDVLDKNSVEVNGGFYDSTTNSIIWNPSTSDLFSELLPRQTRSTRFSFSSKDLGNLQSLFKNPEILIDAKLKGKRLSEADVEEVIESEIFRRVRFATRIALNSTSFYGIGPFENEGAVPPTAETPTEYTVQWDVYNTSNDLSSAKVVGVLPSYVKWNNNFTPSDANVTFDSATRTVTWNLNELPAGTGYSSEQKTMAFQVTFTPSISQVGQTPDLVTSQQIFANDGFTNAPVSTPARSVSISADDLRLSPDTTKVTQ